MVVVSLIPNAFPHISEVNLIVKCYQFFHYHGWMMFCSVLFTSLCCRTAALSPRAQGEVLMNVCLAQLKGKQTLMDELSSPVYSNVTLRWLVVTEWSSGHILSICSTSGHNYEFSTNQKWKYWSDRLELVYHRSVCKALFIPGVKMCFG